MPVEMEFVFLRLLEVSAASAVVILAVVLLSSIINRSFTAKWKYWLWMVLAVRLLLPFNPSFEAAPAKVEVNIPYNPTITIPIPAAQAVPAPPVQPTGPVVTIPVSQPVTSARIVDMVELLIFVWLAGAAVFLLWQLVSYLRFRRQVERWGLPIEKDSVAATVRQQVEAEFGIRGRIPALIYDQVSSPMMIGFFCPLLILPQEEYSAQSLSYILRHELTHYKRRDIWYKALMLLANAVHWFNPAVWLMVREASRDLEISCDAAVMKNAGMEERREYSEIILSCVHRELKMKTSLSTHFYGGKKALKERFANILSTKKRRRGLLAFAAVLLCGALAGGMVAFGIVNGSPPEYWARAALSELVTCTVENAEEFYAIAVPTPPTVEGPGITPAPEAIGEFFTRLWKDTMTEDCIQALISDGVFPRMADFILERGREVRFVGWELRKRADGENLYDFTVQMAAIDEPPVAQAAGTIQMVKQEDGRWRASHITVAIEFIDRIPLEGWSYISSFSDPLPQEQEHPQLVCKDDTAARLARAISPLDWLIATAEPPSFDASHPLDAELAARIAFDNTPRLDWGSFNDYPDHPIVKRVDQLREEEPVICDIIYADDAAAALKRLFGVTDWEHHTVEYYNYFPEEGVYITYADLVRGVVYPQVISWEVTANGYSCEVIPVSARSNSIDGVEVTEENIAELAQRVRHYVFTFDMTSGEPVVTGFTEGSLQLQPLPQSITLREWTPFGTELWGLLIDDPEELRLVASLLSTRYLTPSSPGETNWTDGGTPINFELDYGDHTVIGACDPNQALGRSGTIPASFDREGHTSIVISEDGIVYHYPNRIGVQLLAFLDSKGIDMGSWWKENQATEKYPLYFSLGPGGEARALREDDTIGDWRLRFYFAQWENGPDGVPWVEEAYFNTTSPIVLNCSVRLAPYNTDERIYWFTVSQEDWDKMPVLQGSSRTPWFQAEHDADTAPLSTLAPGEQVNCRVAVGGYSFVSLPTEAPSTANVAWVEVESRANPDTAQTEGQGYPTDRLTRLEMEFQEAIDIEGGLPRSSYNHLYLYKDGDDIVLEITVTDEAAVDRYLAGWTGERWDRLVKTPARVSYGTLREFEERVGELDFGPEVEVVSVSAGAPFYSEECGAAVWLAMTDFYAPREEVERWAELPQQLKDLVSEMGIPEDLITYRAPAYHVRGVNYDS